MNQGLPFCIAKPYMAEIHTAFRILGEFKIFCLRHLLLFIQEFKDPLSCSHSRLHNVGNVGYLVDGLGKLPQILDKGLNHPYA